jgi:hypothetical protein
LAVVLVAGAFLAVDLVAGAFLVAALAAPAAAPTAVFATDLVAFFAAPTAFPAVDDDDFLAVVLFAVVDFAVAFLAVDFCAAGTCASWSVSRPAEPAHPCRGRPVRSPPRMILATLRREVNEIGKLAERVALRQVPLNM